MNAVNLIPVEDRRGAGAPGRSGGAVYGLLGGLGLLLVMVAVIFTISHSVKAKQQDLAAVTAQAQAAEAQAGTLQAYTQFATLRETRQQTVASLASSRFDWAHALHELARTVPDGTALTGLRATVSSSTSVGGTTNPLRQSLNVPAIEMSGCATSQDGVAEVMAALRRVDGVRRVSLSSSERNAKPAPSGAGGATAAPSAGADCRAGSLKRATFSMVIFYDAPAPVTGSAPGAAATTTTTTTTAPAASTPAPASADGGTK